MRRRKAPTRSGISTPRTDRSDWAFEAKFDGFPAAAELFAVG